MPSPGLETVTNEIFERIVHYLDLCDIRNLRLASRSAAHKAAQGTFRRFFKTKHVDITRSHLETFAHLTSGGRLGGAVEHLTLVGVVYNTLLLEDAVKTGRKTAWSERQSASVSTDCSEEELAQAEADIKLMRQREDDYDALHKQHIDVALLTEAFSNLVAHTPRGLKNLSLVIVTYREDATSRLPPVEGKCWKRIFRAAAETFTLAVTGLRGSSLPVHTLDVFGTSPQSLGSSVPGNALSRFDWNPTIFASLFSTLRKLTISISDRIINETVYHARSCGDPLEKVDFALTSRPLHDAKTIRQLMTDEANFAGLPQMLELCLDTLEELTIGGYYLNVQSLGLQELRSPMRRRRMHDLARLSKPFRQLRKLSLAGLDVEDADLASFITRNADFLREIELREIYIPGGSFAPVMASIRNAQERMLEQIHVEDIFDDDGYIIQFDSGPEREFTRISGDYLGRNVFECWAGDAKKPIAFHPYQGRSVDSGKIRRWKARREQEFGRRLA